MTPARWPVSFSLLLLYFLMFSLNYLVIRVCSQLFWWRTILNPWVNVMSRVCSRESLAVDAGQAGRREASDSRPLARVAASPFSFFFFSFLFLLSFFLSFFLCLFHSTTL